MPSKITEYHAFIFKVHDSEITFIISFLDEYGREDFHKDLDEFIKIHSQKKKPTPFRGYELPYVRRITKKAIAKKEMFDYDYFKISIITFLQRIVRDALQDMPELLNISSKPLEIKILITSREKRNRYAYHDEKASDKGHIVLELGGGMLLGRIVAQKYFIGRMNYRFVEKILFHEFRHQIELLRGVYKKIDEKYEKLRESMIKKYKHINVGRLCLQTASSDIFTEGLAEFNIMKKTMKVDINMDWMHDFKNTLKKLAVMQNEQEALDYYEEHVATERGPSAYYCGKMMCYLMGLAIAKKKSKTKKIKIHIGRQALDLSKLNEAMNTSKRFSIDQLPKKIYGETLAVLDGIMYYKELMAKYDKACAELGIEEKNKMLTKKDLAEIRQESNESFTKHLSACTKPQTSRLHRLRARIKRLFYPQSSQPSLPSEPQKPS